MDQCYVLFEQRAGPRIFWIPFSQTARVINENPDRKVEIFETLAAAKDAALAVVDRAAPDPNRSLMDFTGRSNPPNVELRHAISELNENTVERL